MLRETFQDLNRLRQIASLAARYGFGELLDRSGFSRHLGRKESVEVSAETRRASAARRFRLFLGELGPTFIKLGQILSTRGDLLPAEYIDELSSLQDQVAPISLEQVKEQIRGSLGKGVEELFSNIQPEPLASASIAQVHRARTLDGEEVVVKVQRPGIADQIRADLSVLRYVARLLEALIEETGVYRPTGIIEEFEKAIYEELDFVHEAENVKAFYSNHKSRAYIRIPRVYEQLSSHHVLTLELISGTKISQADLSRHNRAELAHHILDASFQQLFVDGLFHGDPHPGNLLVLEGDIIGLLDFGIVGRVSKQMQQTLVMLVLAVSLKDADSVARLLYRLGTSDGRANLAAFKADIENILSAHLPDTLKEVNTPRLLRDLLDLAVKYRVRIPKEYALLSRASIATEGILRSLHPDLNILEAALPYAKQLLAGQYDVTQLQGSVMRTLFRLQGFANDLPLQLSQILLDLETGKFAVNVRAPDLEKLNSSLRSAALIAFLGLCACGCIVGAFMAFSQKPWTWRGVPILGILGLLMAAVLFGATMTWYVFGTRFRKLRVRRWLSKS